MASMVAKKEVNTSYPTCACRYIQNEYVYVRMYVYASSCTSIVFYFLLSLFITFYV